MPKRLSTHRTKRLSHPEPKALSTPLADAYNAFMVDRSASSFTPKTLTYYRERLGDFLTYCAQTDITTLDQVTAGTVRAYLLHLQRRNLAPHTVHGAARAIRAFVRFCAADGLLDAAPVFQMPKVPNTILPAFETAEVLRLLDAANERDRLIVLTLLDTGLRAAELIALDGGDINEKSGAVHVRNGKGQKDRTVYLGVKTRRELVRYWHTVGRPGVDRPVWTNQNTGERLTDSGLRQLLRRLADRAGVDHCHPHTFRRTFALWSLRAGMSLVHLQRLMGHADLTVLQRYLALLDDDIQTAHQAAGPVDKLLRK